MSTGEATSKGQFAQMEEEVLEFWDKAEIFNKSVERSALKGDYVFYDGPPFATGTPHYGHIVASLMKDVVPRYWTMNGYKVERKWGWDCHGLPIENIAEKELGFKQKKEIIEYGVDEFNELCRSKVLGYVEEWEKVVRRLGRWADMKNSYRTMDLPYMETIWWVFKQLWDKELIYEGYRSIHVCPRCETTLSQQEVSEGYKDVKDLSAIAKFELVDEPGTFVLAWTTTPWTLIGNVALAVGADIDYVKVKIENSNYILAKERVESVLKDKEYELLGQLKGSELVGKEYKPLFGYYSDTNEELLNSSGDGKKIACLMIENQGKLLLGLREYTKDKTLADFKGVEVKDFLIVPGGRSEVGEVFADTIKRELKEEIDVDNFRIKKYLGRVKGYLEEDLVELYLIQVDDLSQIKNNEPEKFKDWKFYGVDEIPTELLMRATDIENAKDAIKWANAYKIYAGDFVTTEDGTGVVHIAPAFGEDDLNLGKANNLPFIQHVGMDGIIKSEAGEFADLSVKPIDDHTKTDIEIIKYLAHNGLLFHKEKYEHSYPHCWRCETPLINYVTTSWFVNVLKIKDKALEEAKNINWSPAHIKEGRFGNWLAGARDWSISRQRFWASVMPIWQCQCGERIVFGSVADLEKASGESVTDLHKHVVDKITVPCAKCGSTMSRVPDVLDTWFDSGSMPYAQMHYPFENKEKFEANFPAEFIAEGIDQTRAWFYYLHVLSTSIKEKNAFKNVIVNGIVLAEDGKKMSKRLNNYPDPMEVLDKYGADAIRHYLASSSVVAAENLNFVEKGVEEAMRKNNMILWNVYKFYEMYAGEAGAVNRDSRITSQNVLDQWILAKLDELIAEVTKSMTAYDLPRSVRPITEFINDLSTWYIRRSRDRFKSDPSASSGQATDKDMALETTKYILIELAKVMAPFMPFISENLWQKVTGNNFADENKSVHLESWPTSHNVERVTYNVIEQMDVVRKIVEAGLAQRDEKGIKIRQPLPFYSTDVAKELAPEFIEIIKDELNVLEVRFGANELGTEMTEELLNEGMKRELVRTINNLRKNAGFTIEDRAEIYWTSAAERVATVFVQKADELMKDTLSVAIYSKAGEADIEKEVKVNGEVAVIGLKKI